MAELTQYIVMQLKDGTKWVPAAQAEAIRRERDAALIENKNLNTILSMYRRTVPNVDNGTK